MLKTKILAVQYFFIRIAGIFVGGRGWWILKRSKMTVRQEEFVYEKCSIVEFRTFTILFILTKALVVNQFYRRTTTIFILMRVRLDIIINLFIYCQYTFAYVVLRYVVRIQRIHRQWVFIFNLFLISSANKNLSTINSILRIWRQTYAKVFYLYK